MPTSYEIDSDRHLVTCLCWDTLSADEVREHYRDLRSDPRFDPAYDQLADLRAVTLVDATSDDLRDLADSTIFSPLSRRAIVTASDNTFGMSRMFEAFSAVRGQNLHVFRDMGAAREWLRQGR